MGGAKVRKHRCATCGRPSFGRQCREHYVASARRKPRPCRGCGVLFVPTTHDRVFHDVGCATSYFHRTRQSMMRGLKAMQAAKRKQYEARLIARLEPLTKLQVWNLAYKRAWQAAWQRYQRQGERHAG